MKIINSSPLVDKEAFTSVTIKTSDVTDTIGRLEITPPPEDRWRVPFPHPTKDLSEAKYEIKSCSSDGQSGITVTFKGKQFFSSTYVRQIGVLYFETI